MTKQPTLLERIQALVHRHQPKHLEITVRSSCTPCTDQCPGWQHWHMCVDPECRTCGRP